LIDFYLDKFQGLIQMKDAAVAQSAKLVNIKINILFISKS
jgi:hypothetical protein